MSDTPPRDDGSPIESKAFILLLAGVSLAFVQLLQPLAGAVFWAAVLAIVFAPVFRRISTRRPESPNQSALLTVLIISTLVLLPLVIVTVLLVQEAAVIVRRLQSGEFSVGLFLQQMYAGLPPFVLAQLDRLGLGSSGELIEHVTAALTSGARALASQAVAFGQDTFNLLTSFFIMVYLLFFFLRDGQSLVGHLAAALPLRERVKHSLALKFATVIRATVKGNILVSMAQGAVGGLTFWLLGLHAPVLWGVAMAFLSLLPAVGAALVWLPMALYLLATGALWQGGVLVAAGVLVIGLVDNLLRPVLVGKDTRMPDYLILISTLGGMSLFGFNGFVIGPAIAALFIACWSLMTEMRQQEEACGDRTATGWAPDKD